jgi:hypothetical protein
MVDRVPSLAEVLASLPQAVGQAIDVTAAEALEPHIPGISLVGTGRRNSATPPPGIVADVVHLPTFWCDLRVQPRAEPFCDTARAAA